MLHIGTSANSPLDNKSTYSAKKSHSLANNSLLPRPTSEQPQFFTHQMRSVSNSPIVYKNLPKANFEPDKKNQFFIVDFYKYGAPSIGEYKGTHLPRSIAESYVPWAMTSDSNVIYAKYGEHRGFNKHITQIGLKPYTTEISQERRRLCQSELGAIALNKPEYSVEAVDIVSQGIRRYLMENYQQQPDKTLSTIAKNIGHYFFTNGELGFGRLSEQDVTTLSNEYIWTNIIHALDAGTLEQKMAIHDAVGRKVLPVLKGKPLAAYEALGKSLRQEWFDQKELRGRVNRNVQIPATITAGIADEHHVDLVGTVKQARKRGVDLFVRDVHRKSHPEADDYYHDLDTRNLLFGAGISGTTGTLLQAAEAFGPLKNMELKKQYMFAIIGYLVGGGMHSCHETLSIAHKAGIPYNPGSCIESLPDSFKSSRDFQQWNERYYDISTLGAIHWLFNNVK